MPNCTRSSPSSGFSVEKLSSSECTKSTFIAPVSLNHSVSYAKSAIDAAWVLNPCRRHDVTLGVIIWIYICLRGETCGWGLARKVLWSLCLSCIDMRACGGTAPSLSRCLRFVRIAQRGNAAEAEGRGGQGRGRDEDTRGYLGHVDVRWRLGPHER